MDPIEQPITQILERNVGPKGRSLPRRIICQSITIERGFLSRLRVELAGKEIQQ